MISLGEMGSFAYTRQGKKEDDDSSDPVGGLRYV